MNEEIELLKHIYKDASMGVYTIEKLLKDLKEKDNKITTYVEEILHEYRNYKEKSKEYLEDSNETLPEESLITKMMSGMGIDKEVKKDNSDSAIADMLIEGIAMGSIEMEKKIKDYKEEVDKEYLKLAKSFLKFQEKTIDELKKYL